MTVRAALLMLPLVAFVQTAFGQTPPAGVDQALRARANEFFQYFVDGQYRKAFPIVAEEAQDEYFGSPKAELKAFKIDNIKYNDEFTEAIVNLMVKRVWKFQGQEMVPEVPMSTTWKIENGKWVWYNKIQPNTWVTAMGPSDVAVIARKPDGTITGLPDKLDQAMVDAAGLKILQQESGLDKTEVKLSASQPSEDTVIFRNGAQGSVGLELTGVPNIPGFNAKLDKTSVNFGENAALHIQYDPAPGRPTGAVPPPATLTLVVQPFRQQLTVQVRFDSK
jgi:hypothetical protein